MSSTRSQAGPIILWSLIFAAALALMDILLGRDASHTYVRHQAGGLAALALLLLVVHLVAYFLAGLFTAHSTGTVWSGALAATLAALVSGIWARLVTDAPFVFARRARLGAHGLPGSALLSHSLALLVAALAVSSLVAALLGALGALAGREVRAPSGGASHQ